LSARYFAVVARRIAPPGTIRNRRRDVSGGRPVDLSVRVLHTFGQVGLHQQLALAATTGGRLDLDCHLDGAAPLRVHEALPQQSGVGQLLQCRRQHIPKAGDRLTCNDRTSVFARISFCGIKHRPDLHRAVDVELRGLVTPVHLDATRRNSSHQQDTKQR
jgi:hypothetical protein